MATYKVERRMIRHHGQVFNFLTYDASPGNPKKGEEARPASWFLVNSAKRWEVIPYAAEEPPEELDERLIQWLDSNVFV